MCVGVCVWVCVCVWVGGCVCECVCVCVRGREYVWPATACTTAQVHVSGAAVCVCV